MCVLVCSCLFGRARAGEHPHAERGGEGGGGVEERRGGGRGGGRGSGGEARRESAHTERAHTQSTTSGPALSSGKPPDHATVRPHVSRKIRLPSSRTHPCICRHHPHAPQHGSDHLSLPVRTGSPATPLLGRRRSQRRWRPVPLLLLCRRLPPRLLLPVHLALRRAHIQRPPRPSG